MSLHLNLSTGKFLNSSTLFKLSDALLLDVSSGEIVMSNLLVPRAGVDLFKLASLDLNFAQRKSLTDRVSGKSNLITFSRASSGTYVDSDGLIKTSPVNLITYSEQFDQSSWIKLGSFASSQVPNAALAPDGTQSAEEYLNAATGTNACSFVQSVNARPYTFSIYLKAKTASDVGKSVLIGGMLSATTHLREAVQLPAEWTRFTKTGTTTAATWLWGIDGRTSGTFTGINVTREESSFYVWGAQLEEGTTATDYIPTGATKSGAPRFDHDPLNGESLGLLIEESRTNNMVGGTTLSVGWGTFNGSGQDSTWIPNQIISPDGTQNAGLAQRTTGGATRYQNNIPITGSVYTLSIFAKDTPNNPSPTPGVSFNVYNTGGASKSCDFSFTTEQLTGSGVFTDLQVDSYPNDWKRISFKYTKPADAINATCTIQINPWDNNSSVYLWGVQFEEGSFPTSYIPTTTSTATRAADLASITGTNFSSWYNQSEGTVFTEAKSVDGANGVFSVGGTTDPIGGLNYDYNSFNGQWQGGVMDGTFNPVDGSFHKFALTAATTSNTLFTDGNQQDTAVATSSNVGVNLIVGNRSFYGGSMSSTHYLNGHIARLAYFPTRKTDQELIKITDGTLAPAIITYGITSAGGTFNLLSTGTVDYAVDWDSTGGYEESTSNTLPHTYTAGDYDLVVYSDEAYRPYFNNVTADASQITSVVIGGGANLGTSLQSAWNGASNMTSFVCPFDVTSGVTGFNNTWRSCSSLTSFPLIDTSSGTNFSGAWFICESLTSFPQIDTSSGTNFSEAWFICQSLTSFPQIDTSSGTNFSLAWYNCNQITSFPLLDMSSATILTNAWVFCFRLATFPAHMFDTTGALDPTAFTGAFYVCALTAQSIENILVSLDTNGASNITLGIDGGTNAAKTTWTTAANTAYTNLINKGWTISFNA